MVPSNLSDQEALARVVALQGRPGVAGDFLVSLADRLARSDGSLAQARELRTAVAAEGAGCSSALRRAAALSWCFPWLGVALARRELRRRLALPVGGAALTEEAGAFVAEPGLRVAVVVTASADFVLAARSVADFLAAGVTPQVYLVGAAATEAELGRRLRDLRSGLAPKFVSTLGAVADFLAAEPAGPDYLSLHALDVADVTRFLPRVRVATIDLNRRPSASAPGDFAPAEPPPSDWEPEALRRAVVLREQAFRTDATGAEGLLRRWVRTPPETGRSFLRLSADVGLPEAHRALDCLVAMRHVWVVSVDPSLDPYLIERVAHDAAFCEVQTEDVLIDFLRPGDRLRVAGAVGEDLRRAAVAAGVRLFTGPVTTEPWAELEPYYLPQTVRVGARGLLRARRLADTACAPSASTAS